MVEGLRCRVYGLFFFWVLGLISFFWVLRLISFFFFEGFVRLS